VSMMASRFKIDVLSEGGVKPPPMKAVSSHRTPKRPPPTQSIRFLGWSIPDLTWPCAIATMEGVLCLTINFRGIGC